MQADLPGFDKDQINLDVEGNTLKISAERSQVKEEEVVTQTRTRKTDCDPSDLRHSCIEYLSIYDKGENWRMRERSSGSTMRSFTVELSQAMRQHRREGTHQRTLLIP